MQSWLSHWCPAREHPTKMPQPTSDLQVPDSCLRDALTQLLGHPPPANASPAATTGLPVQQGFCSFCDRVSSLAFKSALRKCITSCAWGWVPIASPRWYAYVDSIRLKWSQLGLFREALTLKRWHCPIGYICVRLHTWIVMTSVSPALTLKPHYSIFAHTSLGLPAATPPPETR